jgi:acyl-coenzyme A thioesterase PaaI-like protein
MRFKLPSLSKANRWLFWFAIAKIPLLALCFPKILVLDEKRTVIRIKTTWLTRNHLKSMYFGALAVGADTAGGCFAFMAGFHNNLKVSLVFKDFNASFHRRPESAVYFISNENELIASQLEEAIKSATRVTRPVRVDAYDHPEGEGEPLASFVLGLSLKVRKD